MNNVSPVFKLNKNKLKLILTMTSWTFHDASLDRARSHVRTVPDQYLHRLKHCWHWDKSRRITCTTDIRMVPCFNLDLAFFQEIWKAELVGFTVCYPTGYIRLYCWLCRLRIYRGFSNESSRLSIQQLQGRVVQTYQHSKLALLAPGV